MRKESSVLFDNLGEIDQQSENSERQEKEFNSYYDSKSKRQNPYIVATFEDRYSNDDAMEMFSNETESLVDTQSPLANTLTSAKSSYHSIYSEVQGW